MLWVGKLIIDGVVLQIEADVKDLDQLWALVAAEFALAVLSDLLSRAISLSDALLGDQYSIDTSVRIIKKTSEVNLDELEDSEFYDKLERARQQTTGRVGLMSNILTQAEDIIVIVSLLVGVVAFEPWLIILLVVSIIPTMINEIKFSGTSYSLARSWTQERRELDYLRYAGASDVTAKEVKLFGLSDYLANRFKDCQINIITKVKSWQSSVQDGAPFLILLELQPTTEHMFSLSLERCWAYFPWGISLSFRDRLTG
jgi:ATP-binding cassette subfamily B protein